MQATRPIATITAPVRIVRLAAGDDDEGQAQQRQEHLPGRRPHDPWVVEQDGEGAQGARRRDAGDQRLAPTAGSESRTAAATMPVNRPASGLPSTLTHGRRRRPATGDGEPARSTASIAGGQPHQEGDPAAEQVEQDAGGEDHARGAGAGRVAQQLVGDPHADRGGDGAGGGDADRRHQPGRDHGVRRELEPAVPARPPGDVAELVRRSRPGWPGRRSRAPAERGSGRAPGRRPARTR